MNKMTKGALATGLGVALLVGGGGTLAVWNNSAEAAAGTVVSGDMQLTAKTGTWKNAQGTTIPNVAAYKVVPGDKLTFTQPVAVVLDGDLLKANLAVTRAASTSHLAISTPALTNDKGESVGTLDEKSDGTYTATVTVEFPSTGTDSKNKTVDLGQLAFTLDQVAPSATVAGP